MPYGLGSTSHRHSLLRLSLLDACLFLQQGALCSPRSLGSSPMLGDAAWVAGTAPPLMPQDVLIEFRSPATRRSFGATVRRTLVVTIAVPESTGPQTPPSDLSAYLTGLLPRTETTPPELALLDDRVAEEELLGKTGRPPGRKRIGECCSSSSVGK